MSQLPLQRRPTPDVSGVAIVFGVAAFAVLLALLLTEGGAPLPLAVVVGLATFGAIVGSWRMLRA